MNVRESCESGCKFSYAGVSGRAWLMLAAIFIASVAAPVNQFKVPTVMPALIGRFGLTMTSAGLLMSIFSLAGLVAAFPAGGILARLGRRWTCVLALVSRSLWGGVSVSAMELLCSRVLEGAGMAVLGVTSPVVIAGWFPPESRGLPMGIWSAWVSTGVILMMNLSPLVTPEGQWKPSWWLGTGFACAALVLFLILYRDPAARGADGGGDKVSMRALFREALVIRDVWLISVALFSFNIMVPVCLIGGVAGMLMRIR